MAEPEARRDDLDEGKVAGCRLVGAAGRAAGVLQFVDAPLDQGP